MINVHYAKRIRNPFTTSFSNTDTPSSFGRNFILLLHIDKRIRLSDLTRRYYRNISGAPPAREARARGQSPIAK